MWSERLLSAWQQTNLFSILNRGKNDLIFQPSGLDTQHDVETEKQVDGKIRYAVEGEKYKLTKVWWSRQKQKKTHRM